MSLVENRDLGGGCGKCPQVSGAWEELRLPNPGGDEEGGPQRNNPCSVHLFPTDSSQTKPLPRPVLLPTNPGALPRFLLPFSGLHRSPTASKTPAFRPLDSSSPRPQESGTPDFFSLRLRSLDLKPFTSGPKSLGLQSFSPLEPAITASGWCWASPSGGQRGSGL